MNQDPKTRSLVISVGIHVLVIVCLVFSFEKSKALLPSAQFEPNQPIVEAVMVNQQAVQKEIKRLAEVEKAKVEREKARQQEIQRKEKEAIEKRQKEEALLLELKEQNDKLKKEAEIQRIAKVKREKEEKVSGRKKRSKLKKKPLRSRKKLKHKKKQKKH